MVCLRPYQQEASAALLGAYRNDHRSALLVMPTGTGKSVVMFDVARTWLRTERGRVLILNDRKELVGQLAREAKQKLGMDVGMEMALARSSRGCWKEPVVVASRQTMVRRLEQFKPGEFSLVITDEAHHAVSAEYQAIIDYLGPRFHIGVTASPKRSDEEPLVGPGSPFAMLAYRMTLRTARDEGWLVPVKALVMRLEGLNFKVPRGRKDYDQKVLKEQMEREWVCHELASATLQHGGGGPGLIFTASVAQAKMTSVILNDWQPHRAGFVATYDLSEQGERLAYDGVDQELVITAFKAGRIDWLCAMGKLLEGFDCPATRAITMGRPTKSAVIFCQAIGRALRPLALPGGNQSIVDGLPTAALRLAAIAGSNKSHALALDLVGASTMHDLHQPLSVLDVYGEDFAPKVVARAKRNAAHSKEVKPVEDWLLDALDEQRQVDAQRPLRIRGLLATANCTYREVDLIGGRSTPRDEPTKRNAQRDVRLPTPKMKARLERHGVYGINSFQQARGILQDIQDRQDRGLCTLRMAKILRQHGYTGKESFEEAKSLLDALFARST